MYKEVMKVKEELEYLKRELAEQGFKLERMGKLDTKGRITIPIEFIMENGRSYTMASNQDTIIIFCDKK